MDTAQIFQTTEPAWDIARLFPPQGAWSEEEYLQLPTSCLTEYSHGYVEVLSMPSEAHQLIVAFLYQLLMAFIQPRKSGMALFAPIPVRLWDGKYREPDIAFLHTEHLDRRHPQYWDTPDLVIEVVSRENRQHDFETKRREYAQAGIPEYWIVDPDEQQIFVLVLQDSQYKLHGAYQAGQTVASILLDGFVVDVAKVWDAVK